MGQPLRAVPPRLINEEDRAYRQARLRQEDTIDRLAERIADEEDTRARQRLDEMFNPQKYWSREQKSKNAVAIWVCVILFAAMIYFALNIR